MFEFTLPFLPLMSKVGAYMGILGGIFNCMTSVKYKIVGFTIWLISNCVLIVWAYEKSELEMAEMYLFFFVTSGIGLVAHWNLIHKDAELKRRIEMTRNGSVAT